MRLTSKGQVTIPLALRKKYGMGPRSEVKFRAVKGGVLVEPAFTPEARMKIWIDRVRGSAKTKLTTDQIMQMTRGED